MFAFFCCSMSRITCNPCCIQGSGGCHSDDIEKAEVIIYMEDTNEHTIYIIEKLDVNSYKVNCDHTMCMIFKTVMDKSCSHIIKPSKFSYFRIKTRLNFRLNMFPTVDSQCERSKIM